MPHFKSMINLHGSIYISQRIYVFRKIHSMNNNFFVQLDNILYTCISLVESKNSEESNLFVKNKSKNVGILRLFFFLDKIRVKV